MRPYKLRASAPIFKTAPHGQYFVHNLPMKIIPSLWAGKPRPYSELRTPNSELPIFKLVPHGKISQPSHENGL